MEDTVLSSLVSLPDQVLSSWREVKKTNIEYNTSNILNIVLCGMGGSALGGRLVKSLMNDKLKLPFEVVTGYHIPFYVGEKTLVILCSYSGSTEEIVSCLHETRDKNGKAFVIATGGTLLGLAEDLRLPHYKIDPSLNPSKQPRLAVGYMVGGLLSLLSSGGFIDVTEEEVTKSIEKCKVYASEFMPEAHEEVNVAKKIASELSSFIPILVSAEHMFGATHTFKNQLNETAKTFSASFDLPELNHHLLEGLSFPVEGIPALKFFFVESDLYSERVRRRFEVTKEVLTKRGIAFTSYKLHSEDKLSQTLELLTLGSFVQYYLAKHNRVNMTDIPWVDYLKEQMGKE